MGDERMSKLYKMFLIAFVAIIGGISGVNCFAMANEYSVKIDEKSFPGVLLREYITKNADENQDGYLSKAERDAVKGVWIDQISIEEDESLDYKPMYNGFSEDEKYQRYKVWDCKGLELFPNIENVGVGAGYEIRNFDILRQLPKLKNLDLQYVHSNVDYNISNFKSLKNLKIDEIDCKKIRICNNPKLKKIRLSMVKAKSISINKNKELSKITTEFLVLKSFNCIGNKNLKKLSLYGDFTNKKAKKENSIKKMTIRNNRKLEKLVINNFYKLQNIVLVSNHNLKKIELEFTPKIKKINLKKCKSKNTIKVETHDKKVKVIR